MDMKWEQIFQAAWYSMDTEGTQKCYKTADQFRNLLRQIRFCHATKSITPWCESKIKEKYLENYKTLVDDQQGVNNYAEMVLTLVANTKNESSKWKSCLHDVTNEELLTLIPESCQKRKKIINNRRSCQEMFMTEEMEKFTVNDQQFLSHFGKVSGLMKSHQSESTSEQFALAEPFSRKVESDTSQSLDVRPFNNFLSTTLTSFSSGTKEKSCVPYSRNTGEQNPDFRLYASDARTTSNLGIIRNMDVSPALPALSGKSTSGSRLCSDVEDNFSLRAYPKKVFFDPYQNSEGEAKVKKRKQPLDGCSVPNKIELLPFKTAKEQLDIEQQKKYGVNPSRPASHMAYGSNRKCLGTRRGPSSKFVPPVLNKGASDGNGEQTYDDADSLSQEDSALFQDERLKNIDPKMVKLMLNEIIDHGPPVSWDDIAGLEFAKTTIKEIVVWPMLRPDIFTGLRGPPKGILLFGPPGTGKTLIGKCIASQSKSTFFCISASSLTSKWVGEGEKLVRALFTVARCYQPAVIFIDEIDSLLTQRSDSEHESSRRIKTEFLVQLDGATTLGDERLLIVGATNRPQELDEAARRRLVKRLYIPLPEPHARKQIVQTLLCNHSHNLSSQDLDIICEKTNGYSGADMANLCKEAALGPIRSISFENIEFISVDQVRAIKLQDFTDALKQVRASVSDNDLQLYAEWNQKYGSGCSV